VKIKTVKIQAFKSYLYGADGMFDFMCQRDGQKGEPANLVSIYAPNGFGKTSFYDAVDYCMTNNITRYIRGVRLKGINKKEGSNHNLSGEKQYILRNKAADEVDVNLKTSVEISTTDKVYKTDYKKPNNRSMDYKFNPGDTPSDRGFFRNVMLTQEAIDAFLREDTPVERYSKFIDNQVDRLFYLDNDRIVISRILDDIKVRRAKLDQDKEPVQTKIDTIEVNENIFSDSNELIEEINQKGFTFTLLNNFFDENQKLKLDNKINLERSNLTQSIEQQRLINNTIHNFSSNLDFFKELYTQNLILNSDLKKIASARESKKKILKYKEQKNSYETNSNAVQEELLVLEAHLKRISEFSYYEQNVANNSNEINEQVVRLNELKAEKQLIIDSINIERQSLISKQKDKLVLLEEMDVIPGYYHQIVELQKQLRQYNSILEEEKRKQSDCTQASEVIASQIKYIQTFSIEHQITEWLEWTTTQELNQVYQEYSRKEKALELLKGDEQVKKVSLQKNREQTSAISELIKQSLAIVSETQQSDCPLCNHSYADMAKLQEKIANNPALEIAEKHLIAELSQLLNDKAEIVKSLASLKGQYETLCEIQITALNQEITNNKNKIIISEKLYATTSLDSARDTQVLDGLLDKTLAKPQKELVAFTNSKGLQCDKVIAELQISITNIEQRMEKAESDIEMQSIALNTLLQNKEKLLVSDEFEVLRVYVKDLLNSPYSEKNYTDATILTIQLDTLKKEKCARLADLRTLASTATEQIANVTSVISSEYQHCNLPTLQKLHEDREQALLDSNNKLTQFQKAVDILVIGDFILKDDWQGIRRIINESIALNTSVIEKNTQLLIDMDLLLTFAQSALDFGGKVELQRQVSVFDSEIEKLNAIEVELSKDLATIVQHLEQLITQYFHTDLINQIYQAIDPHPDFKEIKFNCKIPDNGDKPELFVELYNPTDDSVISPTLHFSSAQINVLSLSIFLAKALRIEDDNGNPVNCIFIDDPIQSMDSINVLGLIDLFRNLSFRFDKQLIISTHDENFHELLKKKMPPDIFQAKYLKLASFGKVSLDQ